MVLVKKMDAAKLLESKKVSENINNWIDLIFGCNQNGEEGEDNPGRRYYHISVATTETVV